jgi:hypothetical protein
MEVLSLHQSAWVVPTLRAPVLLTGPLTVTDFVRVHMNPSGHLTLIAPALGANPVELTILYGGEHLSTRSHA